MKSPLVRLALGLALSGLAASATAPALAAGEHGPHGHQAVHGGVLVTSKDIDYELVAKAGVLQLYVSDHGKPMDLSKASAKVTLLAGTGKQDVELKPAGDRLEAAGTFKVGPGTKAVAVVTISGKTLGTARFTMK